MKIFLLCISYLLSLQAYAQLPPSQEAKKADNEIERKKNEAYRKEADAYKLNDRVDKIKEREIHLQYFKKVYGENFENLKDLKFWYGSNYYAKMLALPARTSLSIAEQKEFVMKGIKSYWPTAKQVEAVCKMNSQANEKSESYKSCERSLSNTHNASRFTPIYEKPDSKAQLIGFFNREGGSMFYRGEYINLRPYEEIDPDLNYGERSWSHFLAPVIDYKIITENGIEREWMRLPTMGHPGEAWVGTTDIEGPLPILDLHRSDKLPPRYNGPKGLGLVQLSKTRLMDNSCYIGVEKGYILFKQFIFPMNWDESLWTGGSISYKIFRKEGPEIDIAAGQVNRPQALEYFANVQKFPPLIFRVPLVDFFLGLGNQFRDESQVAMSPGESGRNCDYRPELFYKKIPKDTITAFADRFGGTLLGITFGNPYRDYESEDDKFSKAIRGENQNDSFSVYIHQIHTGD